MRVTVATAALALVLSACSASTTENALAPPIDSVTAVMVPALDGKLMAPSGFTVSYFARLAGNTRFMALSPDGVVYVSQPGSGRVLRLPDDNHDGVADSTVIAATGLNEPHGLAFHKGALYVANTDGVVRLSLDARGKAVGTPVYVNHLPVGGHSTRTIVFGPDGAMYVSVGSSCNLCVESDPDRAAVLRFNEDGSGKRLFAKGLRNAVGLAFHPLTGALWVSQNERDELPPNHEDLPPEEINILVDGADYGWPYCYGNRIPNPEYNNAQRCALTVPPALELQAHSAPLGLSFLLGATKFPLDYRGDLLVAYHGSWNRTVPTGAKIVRIRIVAGVPVSSSDFITGWQRPDGTRWGRPADVLVAADGSVLISDDASGSIYRVSH